MNNNWKERNVNDWTRSDMKSFIDWQYGASEPSDRCYLTNVDWVASHLDLTKGEPQYARLEKAIREYFMEETE